MDLTFDKFKEKAFNYIIDKEEQKVIIDAYNFAKEKHLGEVRLSGEDYIVHPLNVAYILTSIKADYETICAALLHKLLENKITSEELEERFGKNITDLVIGVTKINNLNLSGDTESEIANHRKIFVGISEDVRVIFIKLACRLHNLRTMWVVPEKEAKMKAKETLDILTPIAHRLGMNNIKGELEDLSLRYYKPDIYFSIVEKLNQSKAQRDETVSEMIEKVSSILNENGIKHKIKGRSKSIYSIYKKLDKGKKFEDIYDLLALRVFVDKKEECYQALGYIHATFKPMPKRFKDYIAMPKTNMYQSLHTTVFGIKGELFEIQIRTYEMDEIAENGIASHWSYKEKGSNKKASIKSEMEQKLQFFKSIIEMQNNEITDEEISNSLRENVLKKSVYVFTPNGDVIELANGSTPIDFAYKVHTNVGNKMVGAIVNGNIVSLDYVLKDNDVVKINTSNNSNGPSQEWLNIAYTTQAKNKIKAFFNKTSKEEYLKRGEELIKEELRKRKIPFNDFFTDEIVNKILSEYKYKNLNELYTSVGNNKLPIGTLFNLIYHKNDTKEDIILKRTQNKEVTLPNIKNDIIVEGIDDIKVNIASCCKPVPGDRIIGYITKGNGITVHRMICPNVKDSNYRTINVHWNDVVNKKYPTSLIIHASSNKDLLLKIISKTSNTDITVQSINTISSSDHFMFEITIVVTNKERLQKFIDDLLTLPDVLDVERAIK